MAEKEQIFAKLWKIYKINQYGYLCFQFKLLKSRIILLKTETILNNKFSKNFARISFREQIIRQIFADLP